jgi:hypothetical protein
MSRYTWDTGVPVAVDSDGYVTSLKPNQQVGFMHVRDLAAHGISGRYVVLYDGDGILTPSMTE